jgi:hypothetical protein
VATMVATMWCRSFSFIHDIFGPDIVTEAKEKVKQIRANILTAQSHQKSYTDKRRRPLKFELGTTYTSEFPR